MASTPEITTQAFTQYYTSSDCSVFLEHPEGSCAPILLDRLTAIGYNTELSSEPIFGLNNSLYGFMSQGNLYVQGQLILNFVHPNYLSIVIDNALRDGKIPSKIKLPVDLTNFVDMSDTELKDAKEANKKARDQRQYSTSLHKYPQNFNLRIVLNNSFLYTQDQDKVFLIRGIKITGNSLTLSSTGQEGDNNILDIYTFKARVINTEAI
jgi:hypothetical protein